MSHNYSLESVNETVSLGKSGITLNGSNLTNLRVTKSDGSLATVQGADGQSASDFITKGQFDLVSGVEQGVLVIDYSTKPTVEGFSGGQTKYFDLTSGTAFLKNKVSYSPASSNSYDSVDDRTYIVDTTNGLLLPNPVNKQPHVWSFIFNYSQKGGLNDEDIGVVIDLVEYNGTSEVDVISIEQACTAGNRSGTISTSFRSSATSDTIGAGKGWKLRITSKEGDGNFKWELSQIRRDSL